MTTPQYGTIMEGTSTTPPPKSEVSALLIYLILRLVNGVSNPCLMFLHSIDRYNSIYCHSKMLGNHAG